MVVDLPPSIALHLRFLRVSGADSVTDIAGVRPSGHYPPRPHGISVLASHPSQLKELELINRICVYAKIAARLWGRDRSPVGAYTSHGMVWVSGFC